MNDRFEKIKEIVAHVFTYCFFLLFFVAIPLSSYLYDKTEPPVAVLNGFPTATLNTPYLVDLSQTKNAQQLECLVVSAPSDVIRPPVSILYDDAKKPIYAITEFKKNGAYQILLAAHSADNKAAYALLSVNVSAAVSSLDRLRSEFILTPVREQYGLHSFCRAVLQVAFKDIKQKQTPQFYQIKISEAQKIAQVFTDIANRHQDFLTSTAFVEATSNAYKKILGDEYNWWHMSFFEKLKEKLNNINESQLLPSEVPAHAVAWREIAAALQEVK